MKRIEGGVRIKGTLKLAAWSWSAGLKTKPPRGGFVVSIYRYVRMRECFIQLLSRF